MKPFFINEHTPDGEEMVACELPDDVFAMARQLELSCEVLPNGEFSVAGYFKGADAQGSERRLSARCEDHEDARQLLIQFITDMSAGTL